MKRFALLLLCTIATIAVCLPISSSAKEYPKMSVKDVMTLNSDSVSAGSLRSPMHGDTVLLTGIVAVSPLINYPTDQRINMTIGGNSWVAYLRDTDTTLKQYAGISVIQTDTSVKSTLFERSKTGDIIEVLVRIGSYPITNNPAFNRQFPTAAAVITDAESRPVKTISSKNTLPQIIPVSITDFYIGGAENRSLNNVTGSRYIGMKVELSNLSVIETSPTLILSDEAGNSIYMNNQSNYYLGKIQEFNFRSPILGQKIKKLAGYVAGYSFVGSSGGGGQMQIFQIFSIAPALPADVIKDDLPPQISGLERKGGKLFPTSSDTVRIGFDVVEGDNSLDRPEGIKLLYTTDGKTFKEAPFKSSQFGYTGSIPPLPNHSIVGFKVIATDQKNVSISNPVIGTNLYKVVDGAALIADFQTPIYGYNGTLQLSGFSLTFDATITADNKDFPGSGNGFQNPSLITMQDSPEPWSGFVVGAQSFLSKGVALHRGDKIRVTGTLQNFFGFLTFGTVDTIIVLSSGNNPLAVVVSTSDIGGKFVGDTSVHRWRSMLVEVRDVKIMDTVVPTQPNGGEFSIADKDKTGNPFAFLRVETDASPLYYTTHDSITQVTWRIKPEVGREFSYVRGLIFGGNQFYKLVPRSTNDFAGLVKVQELPTSSESTLSAYPNPFTSETTIEFSIQHQSPTLVRVIDGLGNIVRTLVDKQLEAGAYRTSLESSGLSSGVYSLEVRTSSRIEHKSVIITR